MKTILHIDEAIDTLKNASERMSQIVDVDKIINKRQFNKEMARVEEAIRSIETIRMFIAEGRVFREPTNR